MTDPSCLVCPNKQVKDCICCPLLEASCAVDVVQFRVVQCDTARWLQVHLEDTPVLVHHIAWDLERRDLGEEGSQCRSPALGPAQSNLELLNHGCAMLGAATVVPSYPHVVAVDHVVCAATWEIIGNINSGRWEMALCSDVVGIVALQGIEGTTRDPML